MKPVLEKHGERVLDSQKHNKISIACTLKTLEKGKETLFGAYLFQRRISGARVIIESGEKELCGLMFKNYGCSSDTYTHLPYFTCAAALGQTKEEIEKFLLKLD